MHLKYTFDKMELNGQIIAVPVGDNANDYHGVVKMNGTADTIFDLLKEETTEENIIDTMAENYDVERVRLAEDIRKYIQEFREKGLLVE